MKTNVAGLALVLLATGTAAYETDANGIKWRYYNGTPGGDTAIDRSYGNNGHIPTGNMSGSNYYAGGYNTAAKPLTAPHSLHVLDEMINYTLQEKRHIDKASFFLSSDDQSNIKIAPGKVADVWVTFMNEGAGFENSVGFFTYDLNAPPTRNADGSNTLTSERIIFPRASTSNPLRRSSANGITVYLGEFNGGANGLGIGFLVVANGWAGSGRGPSTPGVKANQDKSWIYYSLRGLNPECVGKDARTCRLDQHAVLLNDSEVVGTDNVRYRRLVLGLEDYKRTDAACDHDFNDLLLAVHVTPNEAISNLSSLPQLISGIDPDTDGDGIKDSADEFPNDANKAFSRYYPGSRSFGTLAYEDQWPKLGDYDLNDVVVRYRSREILNANRVVTALEMDLRLDAVGGNLSSGFALVLPGVPANKVATVVLLKNGVPVTDVVLLPKVTGEKGGAVFEIFSNSLQLMPAQTTGGCVLSGYRNTGQGCPLLEPVSYKLLVTFTTPQTTFPTPPYDPFIFNSNGSAVAKGVEIHLPGKQPTSRADAKLLSTVDDRSVAGKSNTYKSANGLPWALDIPVEWAYPYEFLDVMHVYPKIRSWATSGGVADKNWYLLASDKVSKTFLNGR